MLVTKLLNLRMRVNAKPCYRAGMLVIRDLVASSSSSSLSPHHIITVHTSKLASSFSTITNATDITKQPPRIMGATAVATPVVRMIPARSFVVSTTARNNGKDTTSTTNNGDKEVRDEKDDGDKNLDAAELLQQHYQQEREKEDLKRLQAYNKFGVFSWKGFFLNAIAFTLIGGAILYYASKKKEEQQLHGELE